jgi:hypothetical protein
MTVSSLHIQAADLFLSQILVPSISSLCMQLTRFFHNTTCSLGLASYASDGSPTRYKHFQAPFLDYIAHCKSLWNDDAAPISMPHNLKDYPSYECKPHARTASLDLGATRHLRGPLVGKRRWNDHTLASEPSAVLPISTRAQLN